MEPTPAGIPPHVKKKRLFVLFDGTWQDGINNNSPLTNVSTFGRCLSHVSNDGCFQLIHYVNGVGNGTSLSARPIDGATGRGISAKIRNAYSFISHNYNFDHQGPDGPDEIFLVGYSRGAFAVQCLASFINQVGLLRSNDLPYLRGFFRMWAHQEVKTRRKGNDIQVVTLLRDYTAKLGRRLKEVRIKALLLWDTVRALGVPFRPGPRPLSFVGKTVPGNVEHAFQALALHEKRGKFKPRIWESAEDSSDGGTDPRVKQCWFYGSHVDIGGSGDAALGAVTLLWMIGQLADAQIGVAFNETEVRNRLQLQHHEWDVKINRVRGRLTQSSVLSILNPGHSTTAPWYWSVLGIKSRGESLKFCTEIIQANVLTEIHFTVRHLSAFNNATCDALKGWQWPQHDQDEWKLGSSTIPESELRPITANTAGTAEFRWLKAWCDLKHDMTLQERAATTLQWVVEEGSGRKLNRFKSLLRDILGEADGRTHQPYNRSEVAR